MKDGLSRRLTEAVADSELAPALAHAAAPLVERRGRDAAAAKLGEPALAGLARAVATRPETAVFLSHRPALFERIAGLAAGSLEERSRELEAAGEDVDAADVEAALDDLRLLRREETLFAACADFGGLVPFDAVSRFLSIVAETAVQRALRLAETTLGETAARAKLSVVGMGKIAGREFTHHSDLDLIFLTEGGASELADASRIGQRLISYLTTMTGAGTAYAVDTRLRPSGQQGALVTTRASFERYQCERAELWEHLALLRARAVAGHCAPARESLDRVRREILARPTDPWPYLADLRQRVVKERSDPSSREVHFKTGPGGLMDVDFLAGGALLERGANAFPTLPSVPAMLRAAAAGPGVGPLLRDYERLRRVESRVRWVAGRGVETFSARAQNLGAVAEIVRPGLSAAGLIEEVASARTRIRRAYDAVIGGSGIAALERPEGRRPA